MATTRLIPMHKIRNQSVAYTVQERIDYAINPDKTLGTELVTAYGCDPATAANEMSDYFITEDDLSIYSPELSASIKSPVQDLKQLYHESDYDILEQYLNESKFEKEKWEDIFLLVSLGHYKVLKERLEAKIAYYNLTTNSAVSSVNEFSSPYNQDLYFRLHKRISFMKPETYELLYQEGEIE